MFGVGTGVLQCYTDRFSRTQNHDPSLPDIFLEELLYRLSDLIRQKISVYKDLLYMKYMTQNGHCSRLAETDPYGAKELSVGD